jgi:hypothetical protein
MIDKPLLPVFADDSINTFSKIIKKLKEFK